MRYIVVNVEYNIHVYYILAVWDNTVTNESNRLCFHNKLINKYDLDRILVASRNLILLLTFYGLWLFVCIKKVCFELAIERVL